MNKHLTLEQLENDVWTEIAFPSRLVESCYSYRKIPLSVLTVEQLRQLINQQIGLVYLVPLALDVLSENVLAEGDLYEGDLLASVVRLPLTFWQGHPELAQRFNQLKAENGEVVKELSL
ncbi:contact-dependent growth inhibition system immunity protein [Spirosoma litoris]